MKICTIYRILNTVNLKNYVGSTIRLEKRWREHRNDLVRGTHGNTYLQMSWNKYGEENFEFIPIMECCSAIRDILETYWINVLESANRKRGYNLKDPNNSRPMLEETKIKISIIKKAIYCKEKHPNYGKHLSEETKKK
jgi:group I intron endonuclease